MAMPADRLRCPRPKLLLDLGFHHSLDNDQTQFSGEALEVFAYPAIRSFIGSCTSKASLSRLAAFPLACWFCLIYFLIVGSPGCLFASYNRPSCLVNGRRTPSNFNYRRDISYAAPWPLDIEI